MLESDDNLLSLRKFIDEYTEVATWLERYDISSTFLYRRDSPQECNLVIVIFTVVNGSKDYKFLKQELRRYIPYEFELIHGENLPLAEQKALSFPQTPCILLTKVLHAATLETRLVEIFGARMVYGQSSEDWAIDNALRKRKVAAKAQLQQSLFQAHCYRKIRTLFLLPTYPHERFLVTRIIIQHMVLHRENMLQLGELLRTPTALTHLCLSHNEMESEHAELFSDALLSNTTILHLDVSHNRMKNGIAYFGYVLEKHPVLEYLDVGSNLADAEAGEALGKGLLANTTLKYLGVAECQLSDEGFQAIVGCLLSKKTLTSLDLSANSSVIEKNAFDKLMQLISSNFPLRCLKLNFCGLTYLHIVQIASALQSNHHLKELEIDDNFSNHEARVIPALAKLVQSQSLERLRIKIPIQYLGKYDPDNDFLWPELYRQIDSSPEYYRLDTSELFRKKLFGRALFYFSITNSTHYAMRLCRHHQLYPVLLALQNNYTLRYLHLRIQDWNTKIRTTLKAALQATHTFNTIENRLRANDFNWEKTAMNVSRKSRKKLLRERSNFMNVLVALNTAPLWISLPRDIQLFIFILLPPEEVFRMGKSRAQILECARFIFSHTKECQEFRESQKKLKIIEKEESPGKYSFRFFTPSTGKIPVTIIAYKDKPLAIYKKTFSKY